MQLPLVQVEHVAVLDNISDFKDVIYSPASGYRQDRIKVMGYRTANWDGTLNIPGFVFDQAEVTEWQTYKDYAIGDTVRYKEFYYSAKDKIAPLHHALPVRVRRRNMSFPLWAFVVRLVGVFWRPTEIR